METIILKCYWQKTSNLKLEFSSENFLVGSEFLIKEFTKGFYLTPETDEINISFYYFYEKNIQMI